MRVGFAVPLAALALCLGSTAASASLINHPFTAEWGTRMETDFVWPFDCNESHTGTVQAGVIELDQVGDKFDKWQVDLEAYSVKLTFADPDWQGGYAYGFYFLGFRFPGLEFAEGETIESCTFSASFYRPYSSYATDEDSNGALDTLWFDLQQSSPREGDWIQADLTTVPEPAALTLLALGGLCLLLRRRRPTT